MVLQGDRKAVAAFWHPEDNKLVWGGQHDPEQACGACQIIQVQLLRTERVLFHHLPPEDNLVFR